MPGTVFWSKLAPHPHLVGNRLGGTIAFSTSSDVIFGFFEAGAAAESASEAGGPTSKAEESASMAGESTLTAGESIPTGAESSSSRLRFDLRGTTEHVDAVAGSRATSLPFFDDAAVTAVVPTTGSTAPVSRCVRCGDSALSSGMQDLSGVAGRSGKNSGAEGRREETLELDSQGVSLQYYHIMSAENIERMNLIDTPLAPCASTYHNQS